MISSVANKGKAQKKPVTWNGMYFESLAALCRYHKKAVAGHGLNLFIKNKKPWKGHLIERVDK